MAGWMLVLAMIAAQVQPAPSPPPTPPPAAAASPEALDLGRRLAEAGEFQAIVGIAGEAQARELAHDTPGLSDADRAALLAFAQDRAAAMRQRLLDRAAEVYAEHFSLENLRTIVAFFEGSAGRAYVGRLSATMPAFMRAMQGMDFKADTLAAFCAQPERHCPAPAH